MTISNQSSRLSTYLTRNFASNGNEEQYEEKIVQVPNEVQQAHVVQLVPVEQRLEQSERADNANHEAQPDTKRYLKIASLWSSMSITSQGKYYNLNGEAVINQLYHVVKLVMKHFDLPQSHQLLLLVAHHHFQVTG